MSERITKIVALGGAVAIVLGNAACTSSESEPGPNASIVAVVPEVTVTPTLPSIKEETTRLLGSQAGLNIIYMPISNSARSDDEAVVTPAKEIIGFRKRLLAQDKTLLQTFSQAFDTATYGRYVPKSVDVVTAAPIAISDGCVELNANEQSEFIRAAAQDYVKKDAINIIELDAVPCGDIATEAVAGFASANLIPIMNRVSFRFDEAYPTNEHAMLAVHEFGHFMNVKHAGAAECKDRVRITSCKADVVGDQHSLMSYEPKSRFGAGRVDTFTVPELYKLGLLKKNEFVINPDPGKLSLHTMSSPGLKLAIFGTYIESKYVSYEEDATAAYDVACTPEGKKKIAEEDILYTSTTGASEITYECYRSNKTKLSASVQVRFPLREVDVVTTKGAGSKNDSLLLVDARTDSTDPHDMREDANIADGYTKSGTTVLELEGTVVEFSATKGQNEAVLTIR